MATYDADTRRAIDALNGQIASDTATAVWDTAIAATWHGTPVWFHGDVSAGNLLVRDGRLAAVIDFGCSGVGDPACDVTIAWTLLSGESGEEFHTALSVDSATWARGRGWALWKALITLAEHLNANPGEAATARRASSTTYSPITGNQPDACGLFGDRGCDVGVEEPAKPGNWDIDRDST